ncbi:Ohr family peroxiredoxin [Telluria aromaticivorans]|uniref:Ohr family peroxiredoxin n=1 Tax=Telluria aromaticivorans TaxID=2725995 RepID=A0A7Y2K143_9BURK|nr:Ohr family peroxiredoxin [Telluria aromaticivorans]NNG24752.1 Ohr family peroxiredoxin [Telluria aromaticivorans]
MSNIQKVLLTGKSRTTSADGGVLAGKHDGNLNIDLSAPRIPAAPAYAFEAIQPHPTAEQLFAGAWSACYIAALGVVAKEKKVTLPADTAVDIEVDLGLGGSAYFIQARLSLVVPGLDHALATEIAHAADAICPYSKATRGNIDVVLTVVTA